MPNKKRHLSDGAFLLLPTDTPTLANVGLKRITGWAIIPTYERAKYHPSRRTT